jgi:hypothetical protein
LVPGVKILSQRRNRFFAVEQLVLRIRRGGRRRDPETDAARVRRPVHGNRMLGQSLDLVAKEVSREPELSTIFKNFIFFFIAKVS